MAALGPKGGNQWTRAVKRRLSEDRILNSLPLAVTNTVRSSLSLDVRLFNVSASPGSCSGANS